MNEITVPTTSTTFDVNKCRADFPILMQEINKEPLVYLDNAATTQKPQTVIDTLNYYYQNNNANIHRGVHTLSVKATNAYEQARVTLQKFINAPYSHEIIFTSGATEGINLLASSFGRSQLKMDDEIILSQMEHHSNIVPWQILCEQIKAKIKVIPVTEEGTLDLEAYRKLITSKTKLVAITHVSNAIGTINPVKEIIGIAHQYSIPVLIDGAQAVPHMRVDVQALDCDFYVFSGHKMYGPTGTGILYGKTKWLEILPPYKGGGDMIAEVTFQKTRYNKLPYKFEAGTPHIAGFIGLGTATQYLANIGFEKIAAYEQKLLDYATRKLSKIEGLRIIGTSSNKAAVISFLVGSIHPHDIGTILDHQGIAIRAGHHCAMPLMNRYKVVATVRASFGIYNTIEDIDLLAAGIIRAKEVFE